MEMNQAIRPKVKRDFSDLPFEVLFDILKRVPLESLSNCRWVCKSWYEVIIHPLFPKNHHEWALKNTSPSVIAYTRASMMSYFTNPETPTPVFNLKFNEFQESFCGKEYIKSEVVGHLNGLLCCSSYHSTSRRPLTYFVCNPITQEILTLPRSRNREIADFSVSGFGYDSVNDEYKVIRFNYYSMEEGAELLTLGSKKWRVLEPPPYYISTGDTKPSNVFFNGCLHWLCYDDVSSVASAVIVSFDVGTEEFSVIKPPHSMDETVDQPSVGVLEGYLCFIEPTSVNQRDIWVMKDYGVEDSWVKKYIFSDDDVLMGGLWNGGYEVVNLENGELLMVNVGGTLGYYNPQSRTFRPSGIDYIFRGNNPPIVHFGSLYSPKHIRRSKQR